MVGLELPVLAMEHMYLITEDMPEVAEFNAKTGKEMIHAVDFDGEIYLRQERGGMLIGTYEKAGVPWSETQTPWNFGARTAGAGPRPHRAVARGRLPAFPGVRERRHQADHQRPVHLRAGRQSAGRAGARAAQLLGRLRRHGRLQPGRRRRARRSSNWMIHGDPGADIWAMDVARYGDWATMAYTNAKVRENYSRRFSHPLSRTRSCRPGGRCAPRRSTICLRRRARSVRRRLRARSAAVVRAGGRQGRVLLAPLERFRARRARVRGGARAASACRRSRASPSTA